MLWTIPDIATKGNGFVIESLIDGQSTIIPANINVVITGGYYEAGDGGSAIYSRSVIEPAHAGKFQSADGAWWSIANTTVSARMFGAKGDLANLFDDGPAINAMIAYANTLVGPSIVLDQGDFYTTQTLNFNLPNNSNMQFLGSIYANAASASPTVRIGSNATNRFGYRVEGLKVFRTVNDTAGGSVGIQIRNIVFSNVDICRVTGFKDGVLVFADKPNGGVSYNTFTLGQLHDNFYNLHLQANGGAGGYVNENTFIGGSFNHSSTYPNLLTTNIWIDYDGVYKNNNNRFFCPSLEDNSLNAIAVTINGANNIIYTPRLENPNNQAGYTINFTINSNENQIIGNGFSVVNSNIVDQGADNCFVTREGITNNYQTPDALNKQVYKGKSSASSSAKIFAAYDTVDALTFYARGDGKVYSKTDGYFENGIRYATSSGTLEDRGLFIGNGTPEGVVTAQIGSLYVSTAGGAGTTLYVKQSGSGNTGWVGK